MTASKQIIEILDAIGDKPDLYFCTEEGYQNISDVWE